VQVNIKQNLKKHHDILNYIFLFYYKNNRYLYKNYAINSSTNLLPNLHKLSIFFFNYYYYF